MKTKSIYRELSLNFEVATLLASHSHWHPPIIGSQQLVMTIPGFGAGDLSLTLLNGYLQRSGFEVIHSGIRANIACSEDTMAKLEDRLLASVQENNKRIWLVGHSRGGLLAKVLAQRYPQYIQGVVALGTPFINPMGNMHELLLWDMALIALLQKLDSQQISRAGCLDPNFSHTLSQRKGLSKLLVSPLLPHGPQPDSCCQNWWIQLGMPIQVPLHTFYSHRDGVIDWKACLLPGAVPHLIHSSHCGMAVNLEAFKKLTQVMDPSQQSQPVGASLGAGS
jgi:triacylglycerol lipase